MGWRPESSYAIKPRILHQPEDGTVIGGSLMIRVQLARMQHSMD